MVEQTSVVLVWRAVSPRRRRIDTSRHQVRLCSFEFDCLDASVNLVKKKNTHANEIAQIFIHRVANRARVVRRRACQRRKVRQPSRLMSACVIVSPMTFLFLNCQRSSRGGAQKTSRRVSCERARTSSASSNRGAVRCWCCSTDASGTATGERCIMVVACLCALILIFVEKTSQPRRRVGHATFCNCIVKPVCCCTLNLLMPPNSS